MSDYDDEDFHDDYDPWDHMVNDPEDFQMNGYGGFGYDTSHVKSDGNHSALALAAKNGNLGAVQSLVLQSLSRRVLLNQARRWTEVDYRASGFTKEYEWFDLTPLALAASHAHSDIVKYLLLEGADPTLKGCPSDDVHMTALGAAKNSQTTNQRFMAQFENVDSISTYSYTSCLPPAGEEPMVWAATLLCKKSRILNCIALLEAADPFWKAASCSHSRFGRERATSGYSNKPSDHRGLVNALEAVDSEPSLPDQEELDALVAKIQALRCLARKENDSKASKKNARTPTPRTTSGKNRKQKQHSSAMSSANTQQVKKCHFFPKCRYGADCRFSHEA
jgi:hypothetical protein